MVSLSSLVVEYQGGTKIPKVATYRYSRKGMVQILYPFGCRTHHVANVDLEWLSFGSQKAGLSVTTKSQQDFKLQVEQIRSLSVLKMSEEHILPPSEQTKRFTQSSLYRDEFNVFSRSSFPITARNDSKSVACQ